MATKNNIRSIRFSDELAELIDRQAGRSFTEKFENLVTHCVWELPQKEAELKRLDEQIADKRNDIARLMSQSAKLQNTLNKLKQKMDALDYAMAEAAIDWHINP